MVWQGRRGDSPPYADHPGLAGFSPAGRCSGRLLLEDPPNGGHRDSLALGYLVQCLPAFRIYIGSASVQLQRIPPDVPAFESRAANAGFDSLDDQIAFELRDRVGLRTVG